MIKQWISVKTGLSRDPKHRRAMGESVWLFLHMLDICDWQTGICYDWKDANAAEDMGQDIRPLRESRRKLENAGYIVCVQKQRGQDIVIQNWTNPREYSGNVINKKQGYENTPPTETAQGDAQGDAQGSINSVTPTYSSKNKVQIKEKADKPPTPPEIMLYREVTSKYPNKAAYEDVISAIQKVSFRLRREATAADLAPHFKKWCTVSGNLYNFSVWLLEWAVTGTQQKDKRSTNGDAIKDMDFGD